ncbi:hypothetical protein [Bradyrhizobium cenepequi]|uniref:hypothetical protein n=1 Tax=Bradyrhizobium cenepequi TaxID=2821403 RepID=UPI001CE34DD6|nr:hypothetical protein [Bradyrhizobium cenepequi]MCA6113120.1 hypothetical protein [Bradyrhizobium cenepequi]
MSVGTFAEYSVQSLKKVSLFDAHQHFLERSATSNDNLERSLKTIVEREVLVEAGAFFNRAGAAEAVDA